MTIGAIIKKLRQEQDITQEQLADALGITSRAVSQWETDRTAPDISQLPALANFFDVTTDCLLGVDISSKEEEVGKILKHIRKYQEQGDMESTAKYLREKLKIYPNEPVLLSELASALQDYYFNQGKADTEELKKEKSDEIIALCERALRYHDPTENTSFPKQILITQYISYLHDKEKAEKLVMTLPNIFCTRERYAGELYDGKEALAHRQSALWNLTNMMQDTLRNISCDNLYTCEQKIAILKAADAMSELITGGRLNFFHCKAAVNAATEAVYLLNLGEKEKAIDMLENAYYHADCYENRPDGEKYAPCWFSEIDDKRSYVHKTSPDTAYDSVYNIIIRPENNFLRTLYGSERFESLMKKLKEKITK